MQDFILANEAPLRLSCFVGIFAVMAAWEALRPRRRRLCSRWQRWPGNVAIVALSAGLVRLVFPLAAVGVAFVATERGWGLLPALDLPFWAAALLAILLMDLAIYLQHVLFHAVPALWRLHRMHHADPDIDLTTGARFHPLEILASMGIKMGVVAALGAPPVAVILFEVLLNATAMFNHSNVYLPLGLDRVLRWVLVTPDMHRVHHSHRPEETNSNFGFNLPWWDRLFGTYRAQPAEGHDAMIIGIDRYNTAADQRFDRLLIQPFRRT